MLLYEFICRYASLVERKTKWLYVSRTRYFSQTFIRLTQAGTVAIESDGDSDTMILKEIKESLKSNIEKELEAVSSKNLELKQKLIAKFLE